MNNVPEKRIANAKIKAFSMRCNVDLLSSGEELLGLVMSVGPSVGRSVSRSVRPSVGRPVR